MATIGEMLVRVGLDNGEFNRSMQQMEGGFETSINNITGLASQLGIALSAPALLASIYAIGSTFEEAENTIRVGTGATGTVLEGLKADFESVFTNVPTDAGNAATAIADLNTRLGLTDTDLQNAATQFLNLSRIMEIDVGDAIAAGTRVMGDWTISAEDSEQAMDLLFRTSQTTGIHLQTLMTTLVGYGAPLREMNFEFEEAAALLGSWEQAGVNTELVLGGLKMAIGALGRAGVADTRQGMQEIITAIETAGTEAEATEIAIAAFGQRAAVDMKIAIQEGRFEIDELAAALASGTETINKAAEATLTINDRLQVLKNRAMENVEPIGTSLLTAVEDNLKMFDDWRKGLDLAIEALGVEEGAGLIGRIAATGGAFTKLLSPAAAAWDAFELLGAKWKEVKGPIEVLEGHKQTLKERTELATDAIVKQTLEYGKYETASKDAAGQDGKTENAVDLLMKSKKKLTTQTKEAKEEQERAEKVAQFYTDKIQNLDTATGDLTNELLPLITQTQALKDAWDENTTAINDLAPEVENLTDTVMPAHVRAVKDVEDAMKALGLTSTREAATLTADAQAAYDALVQSGMATQYQQDSAYLKVLEAMAAESKATTGQIPEDLQGSINEMERIVNGPAGLSKIKTPFEAFSNEVSTIVTNLAQDLGRALFDGDLSFAEKGVTALKSLGSAVVAQFTQPFINAIVGPDGLIMKALNPLIDKLTQITGGFFGVGGSAAGSAATGAAGSAGSAAGSVGQAATSAVAGSIAGVVTAVSSVVSAISDVIGNIQMAQSLTKLTHIEENTRFLRIDHVDQKPSLKELMWEARDFLYYIHDDFRAVGGVRTRLDEISHNTFWTLGALESWGAWLPWRVESMDNSLKTIATKDLSVNVNVYMDSTLISQQLGLSQQLQLA